MHGKQITRQNIIARALRETETETKTDRFLIIRKLTNGQFLKDRFSVYPILVGFWL
jgi:hypothetical protein